MAYKPYILRTPPKFPNPKLIEKGTPMTNLPFALSYSKIQEWYNCPTKFYANYLTKEIKFVDTPETILGKDKHLALELYGRTGQKSEILEEHEYTLVTKIRNAPNAIVLYESDSIFGFTDKTFTKVESMKNMWDKKADGQPYFLIGQADIICITGTNAIVVDHKSGKMKQAWTKPNETDKLRINVQEGWFQLQLYAIATFLKYPEVNAVKCILNYLKSNAQNHKIYRREELAALQLTARQTCEHVMADYAYFLAFKERWTIQSSCKSLMEAHSEAYSKESALCNWCGYKDKCIKYINKNLPIDIDRKNNGESTTSEPIDNLLS